MSLENYHRKWYREFFSDEYQCIQQYKKKEAILNFTQEHMWKQSKHNFEQVLACHDALQEQYEQSKRHDVNRMSSMKDKWMNSGEDDILKNK